MRCTWKPATLRPLVLSRSARMPCGGSSSGSLPTAPAAAPHLVRRVLWVRLRPVWQLGQWDVEGLRQERAGEAVAAEWPSFATQLWKLCRGLADRQQSAPLTFQQQHELPSRLRRRSKADTHASACCCPSRTLT